MEREENFKIKNFNQNKMIVPQNTEIQISGAG